MSVRSTDADEARRTVRIDLIWSFGEFKSEKGFQDFDQNKGTRGADDGEIFVFADETQSIPKSR